MRSGDALFRVIVLGGLALVSQESCGSSPAPSDAGDAQNADEFPSELPVYVEAGTNDAAQGDGATPDDATSSDGTTTKPDGFPQEGPPPP